jgi:hypothetical protein
LKSSKKLSFRDYLLWMLALAVVVTWQSRTPEIYIPSGSSMPT